jgi:hypothetical protein
MKRLLSLVLLCGVAACAENADRDGSPCTDANTFDYDGARYCIVIEEGFLSADCPDELPEGRDFDDFFVCSDADTVPDDVEGEARRRGLAGPCTDGETRDAGDGCNTCTCSGGVWACTGLGCETCEEGTFRPAGDGCNTCQCIDGDWACTTAACLDCTDGQTRIADDGCNTCTCVSGAWACTTMACGECTDGETRDAGDGCNTCECVDGAWACTEIACEECTDGETRTADDGCNTCTCVAGAWACTDLACGECTDGETRSAGDGCNTCECVDGAWACTEIACTGLEACLEACGVGCPEPRFQLCATDGTSYCSSCEAACYEADLAPDREPCDCPIPPGTRRESTPLVLADSCTERNPDDIEMRVAYDNAEIQTWLDCAEGEYPTIEEGNQVLVRAVFQENPEASLTAVLRDAATDTVTLFLTGPQYCGGPAPMSSVLYVVQPFGDETGYEVETCTHTFCAEFFP